MFTGIVEEVGTVAALERHGDSARLTVTCHTVLDGTARGDSISVSGCCLTVSDLPAGGGFAADLMAETLDRTALGALRPGARVNLERALAAGGRLGGHLVTGHVDGASRITDVRAEPRWTALRVALPPALCSYVVEKGSVAVDGVSLTVTAVDGDAFEVGLIPHTLAVTTLGERRPGDRVNLEADLIAKYVQRLLAGDRTSPYTETRP